MVSTKLPVDIQFLLMELKHRGLPPLLPAFPRLLQRQSSNKLRKNIRNYSSQGNFLVAQRPIVNAGFIWQPETWPMARLKLKPAASHSSLFKILLMIFFGSVKLEFVSRNNFRHYVPIKCLCFLEFFF